MNKDIKKNIFNGEKWQHIAWIVFFVLCYSLVKFVLFSTIFFQVIHILIFSESQIRVSHFGAQLATYVYQLISYLTFNSDIKPFPFNEWPSETEVPSSCEMEEQKDDVKESESIVDVEIVAQVQTNKKDDVA